MNTNEVKKALYKQNPHAKMKYVRKDGIHFHAIVDLTEGPKLIFFEVPFSDIGEAIFEPTMEAKLLIRYLVLPETAQTPNT